MYYMNDPIEFTLAEGLVLPVRTDGVVVKGSLHDTIARTLGPEGVNNPYLFWFHQNFVADGFDFSNVRKPMSYRIPRGVLVGTTVFPVPTVDTLKSSVRLTTILKAMVSITQECVKEQVATLAVPGLTTTFLWDSVEEILERVELGEGQDKVEMWLYPREGGRRDE